MDKVFQKMQRIADRSIQHYKTDFTEYDTRTYGRMYDGTHFLWCVRPCGTYICGIPKTIKSKTPLDTINWFNQKEFEDFQEYLNDVRETSKAIVEAFHDQKYYYVVKGESIREISKEQALKEIA